MALVEVVIDMDADSGAIPEVETDLDVVGENASSDFHRQFIGGDDSWSMEMVTSTLYEVSLVAVFVAPISLAAASLLAFGVDRLRHRGDRGLADRSTGPTVEEADELCGSRGRAGRGIR